MHRFLDPILRPLARLAVARGWRYGDIDAHLRAAMIEAAESAARAGPDAASATDSRISVMTGLPRREVARLRTTPPETDAAGADTPNPLARLVARWLADPARAGAPLPRRGPGSFDDLAADILRDVHPRTFLDQLVAAGTVRDDGDRIVLLDRAYRPRAGSDDQLDYLARNVGDHLAASVDNVTGEPRHFERAVHYDGLSGAAVAELDALWRAQIGPALEIVNARAAALQTTSPGAQRFRAGGYFHDTEGKGPKEPRR